MAAVRGAQRAVGVQNYLEVSSAGRAWAGEGDPGGAQGARACAPRCPPAPALAPQEAAQRLKSVAPVKLVLSSRTDAGVHALSNAAHLDVQRRSGRAPFSPAVLTEALNTHLKHPAIR